MDTLVYLVALVQQIKKPPSQILLYSLVHQSHLDSPMDTSFFSPLWPSRESLFLIEWVS